MVVPEAQLDAETDKITQSIKEKPRAILAMGKAFYYKQLGLSVKDAYDQGTDVRIKISIFIKDKYLMCSNCR